MNILMMSNTYRPFVGGVERSIQVFSEEFRSRGHNVLIVAPAFGAMAEEQGVLRVPAIQNFNGTDFSVPLPISGGLSEKLRAFRPDIVHSHHPFLMGDTALRVAARHTVPIVFTFHTFFESYTHYVPGDSPQLKRFVATLATGYANMCNIVIAPSESIALILKKRGVTVPVEVVHTGIDIGLFSRGDRKGFRVRAGIPPDAFVAGLVSRLAPEKNIPFVMESIAQFFKRNPDAHFLVAGTGPVLPLVQELFRKKRLSDRLHLTGTIEGRELADAYHAMDVFVFASQTETQGLVLAEAMAAGVPVLAVDAPAVRDVVVEKKNGRLLPREEASGFVAAIEWFRDLTAPEKAALSGNARKTAAHFSKDRCAQMMLGIYSGLVGIGPVPRRDRKRNWDETKRLIRAEWEILGNVATATESAFRHDFD